MPVDPHAINSKQHEPRVPGGQADEPAVRQDHPKKPFRTPSKNKTHPRPTWARMAIRTR